MLPSARRGGVYPSGSGTTPRRTPVELAEHNLRVLSALYHTQRPELRAFVQRHRLCTLAPRSRVLMELRLRRAPVAGAFNTPSSRAAICSLTACLPVVTACSLSEATGEQGRARSGSQDSASFPVVDAHMNSTQSDSIERPRARPLARHQQPPLFPAARRRGYRRPEATAGGQPSRLPIVHNRHSHRRSCSSLGTCRIPPRVLL